MDSTIPGSGRSPGGRHGNPLQYSCLKNPHRESGWAGYSPYGHKGSDIYEVMQHMHTFTKPASISDSFIWLLKIYSQQHEHVSSKTALNYFEYACISQHCSLVDFMSTSKQEAHLVSIVHCTKKSIRTTIKSECLRLKLRNIFPCFVVTLTFSISIKEKSKFKNNKSTHPNHW